MDGANLYHTGNAWHAFRRLHSTLMSKRMSLFDLRAQMGHADIKTTQKYVATPVDARAEALAAAQANVIPFKKAKTA
jgi:integrase